MIVGRIINYREYTNPKITNPQSLWHKNYPKVLLDNHIDSVSFTGVKTKTLDIAKEKEKLIKTLDKILQTKPKEARETNSATDTLKLIERKEKLYEELVARSETFLQHKIGSKQQYFDGLHQLIKEAKRLAKIKETPQKQVIIKNEEIDYALINKFKTAILNDNYNLVLVLKEHYKGLNQTTSLDEIKQKYPTIAIPKSPKEIISQNILKTLTREFYTNLEIQENKKEYIQNKLEIIFSEISTKLQVDKEFLLEQLKDFTTNEIIKKYKMAVANKTFSTFPEQTKKTSIFATDTDIKLLKLDFDKFVIDILKKQYFELAKPNNIKYQTENTNIELRKLASTPYKFERVSEKIKSIIKDAEKIELSIRDYDNYSIENLKTRLEYYANHRVSENEKIFERIMEFFSCKFVDDDVKNLKAFLRELDLLSDDKKKLNQTLETINSPEFSPIGTHKLNEIELREKHKILKQEQEVLYQLISKQNEFDNVINILLTNKMNEIANLCSKYRPQNLNHLEDGEFIVQQIKAFTKNEQIINPSKLDHNITCWNTYKYFKNKYGATYQSWHAKQKELIKNAENIAKENNIINPIKAGQYIINTEIIENYPESAEFIDYSEILNRIMEKTNGNNKKALSALNRYDEYKILTDNAKYSIETLLNIFDIKDSIDKSVLKHIIETDYVTNSTIVEIPKLNTIASIEPNAKKEILEKYMFPRCLDYFEAFEKATKSITGESGGSGVKRTGSNNNSLQHKMEIKVKAFPDRLFSSQNDYAFDIYSEKGLH